MNRKRRLFAGLIVGFLVAAAQPSLASVGPRAAEPPTTDVVPLPAPTESPTPSPTSSASPSPSASPTPDPSATPTPTGSPSPEEPKVRLLNPSKAYVASSEEPKISDAYDGIDQTYHITAATTGEVPNSIVEASLAFSKDLLPPPSAPVDPEPRVNGTDFEIGLMSRVAEDLDVYELDWDIPDNVPDGPALLVVRVYEYTSQGFVERAKDEVEVSIQHNAQSPPTDREDPVPTVGLTWAPMGGELGFYRSVAQGGNPLTSATVWATVVDGTTSSSTSGVTLNYSIDPLSKMKKFTSCGSAFAFTPQPDGTKTFRGICELKGADLPTEVTAVGAIPSRTDFATGATNGAAEVHTVTPYIQDTRKMDLQIEPFPIARALPKACLPFVATVHDQFGRPVPSVNIDVDFQGPTDNAGFGATSFSFLPVPQLSSFLASGTAPNSGGYARRTRSICNSEDRSSIQEGFRRVVAGPDIAHVEFQTDAGFGGAAGIGGAVFDVRSSTRGIGHLTGWVDDEPMTSDAVSRLPDTDLLEETETPSIATAYWYAEDLTLVLDREQSAVRPGDCAVFAVKVGSGSDVAERMNVDVHASGPDGISFCDPPEASPRRSPEAGGHTTGAAGEGHDAGGGQPTIHTEGETDSQGDFVFGITSPVGGDAQVVAWLDGEKDTTANAADDDVLGFGEITAETTQTWALTAADANVRLISPSGWTAGSATISNLAHPESVTRLVAQVDAPSLIPQVQFSYASSVNEKFEQIGSASRVEGSDVYELGWDTSQLAPGTYTVRVAITDTEKADEQTVTVDNSKTSASIADPADLSTASFDRKVTTVQGVASAGTDLVDLYYTTTAMRGPNSQPTWKKCGSSVLEAAEKSQPFSGKCALEGRDQPYQLTAIAAVASDEHCDPLSCTYESQGGHAFRLFGRVAHPLITLDPYEAGDFVGSCRKLTVTVTDERGAALSGVPIDVVVPADDAHPAFCVPDESESGSQPSGSYSAVSSDHLDGRTGVGGSLTFGLSASAPGDTDIIVWVDQADDGVQAQEEPFDASVLHWTAAESDCTQVGTPAADELVGTPGPDRLCGLGGDDVLKGLEGDDVLIGGAGHDYLYGGPGADRLNGGTGTDDLDGGEGPDRCPGGWDGADKRKHC
jgi:hypothetical protein